MPSIPESPTSLPVSYKKVSGSLPTTGWAAQGYTTLWTGLIYFWESSSTGATVKVNINDFTKPLTFDLKYDTSGIETATVESITSDHSVQTFIHDGATFSTLVYADKVVANGVTSGRAILNSISVATAHTYTISDTSITANTSVKMYLTDAGGVKAYSKASGSITVIRDSVPTSAIPYEYEVEETSAEGLFEVINAYVPAVPTKTSQLTNDSGFITAADIPSAGEWVTETGTRATLTEAGTYQVIATVNDMQSIVYWDGSTAAYGTKSTAPSVSTSGGTAYLFINCAYPLIDASGTLTVHLLTVGNSSGTWTETDTVQSGFKYRKIN